ncbi:AUGMIN subunit 8-like [Cucurbita maxima]|uniref:AUGMIN subunit 8-like n=1 Tax=Cucurbita maxima TaxID=3661 RepID=A0A6J1I0B0_CUCMA|nr:AUGMIN subunit 8-like [Cucurbita maxima]XP_022969574.1 AUGMIN subunit 8-like [Cucurbita maxima]XP_022969575.1 AUGMIN subunit 8-like [Cucurbita maxima]XP_022969576.1 AUGMIN subunit 8-like [Cucurbita maxima]
MDIVYSDSVRKHSTEETTRHPLVLAERNNVPATRRSRTREVSSRYNSPIPSSSSTARRCPSPNASRTVSASSQLGQKRAQLAERKRPSTPPSPKSPSTRGHDLSDDLRSSSKTGGSRLVESLWPSTMRSLTVSFQSDIISIPVSKKEKPVPTSPSDRTLRPSSNVAHKQVETPTVSRKPTPERKRSPLKGKIMPDQLENSKPIDGVHTRLIDQQRWPSRIGGKISLNASSRNVDLTDTIIRSSSGPLPGIGISSLRRTSSESMTKHFQKSNNDSTRILPLVDDGLRMENGINSADDCSLQASGTPRLDRLKSTPGFRSQSLLSAGSRLPSPIRASVPSSSVSRGLSPARPRPSTPPARGVSPSRIRPTNSSESTSKTSVLSFIADFKGKKGAHYIEDAHQLRLLYNRYTQWRFSNARSKAILDMQKVNAERMLCNVWKAMIRIWDSVARNRISIHMLKLELKLNKIMNNQMVYLDEWDSLETDHINSLSGALLDLEASTLRVPVTSGATADNDELKGAIFSALDVMQVMATSIGSLLSQVERMNGLVSELSIVASRERAMLDECESLLASTTVMQVEEYSLRTHLLQVKQALERTTLNLLPHQPS